MAESDFKLFYSDLVKLIEKYENKTTLKMEQNLEVYDSGRGVDEFGTPLLEPPSLSGLDIASTDIVKKAQNKIQ